MAKGQTCKGKKIDARQVERLAQIGCTTQEIAQVFSVSSDTIQRHFAAELENGRGDLHQRLRKRQVQLAMKGNCKMLIWLGQQYLGQKNKQEDEGLANTLATFLKGFSDNAEG